MISDIEMGNFESMMVKFILIKKIIFYTKMLELYDKMVETNRKEVYARLEMRLYNSHSSPTKGIIGLRNGLLDYRNEIKFIEFTPDIFCIKKINVEWDDDYLVKK